MLETVRENLIPLKSTAVLLQFHTGQLTTYLPQLFARKSKLAHEKKNAETIIIKVDIKIYGVCYVLKGKNTSIVLFSYVN